MTLTTNQSPIREKLGTPVGEAEVKDTSVISAKQHDEERENSNFPEINSMKLDSKDKREYIVDITKSPNKADKEKT